jgi:hypothetical protein
MKHCMLLVVVVLGACQLDEGALSQSSLALDGSPGDTPKPPMDAPTPPADVPTPPTDGPKPEEPKKIKYPVDEKGKLIPGGLEPTTIDAPGWWEETDGIKPEVPGCHYAYADKQTCQARGERTGWLGESCELDKQKKPTNVLIETNPDPAGNCHFHNEGKGHPDRIDCDKYCKGTYGEASKGTCVTVEKVCDGKDGKISSAKCDCEKPPAPPQPPDKKEPMFTEDALTF